MNLKSTLLPYQRQYVENQARFKVWVAARQIGKSTAVSFETVDVATASKVDLLIVSASQRQSKELLEKVKFWTRILKSGISDDIVTRETTEEVQFSNGSRIISLPANPDTIRGFSGHVFLDEFAFHQDSKAIWASVFPISTRGYNIRIISTPNGRQNMFAEIWERGGAHWYRQSTDVYTAKADGLEVDIDQLKAGTPDQETWAQEYECQFIDEATAFLTYEMIRAVEHEDAGLPGLAQNGSFYIGADIGRRRDLTVFWVLEAVGDVLWTREVVEMRGVKFADQDAELDRLASRYAPQRICMDQSGMGEKVVEDAKSRHGQYRVEGLLFSGPVKQDLAFGVRRTIESRSIRIPANKNIREDLHSVQKVVTAAGNVRFDAERTNDGHADRFWALALAVHAAQTPVARAAVLSGGTRGMLRKMAGF